MPQPTISFEYFPPKSEQAGEKLFKNAQDLNKLSPLFMTMTFGAGGSAQDGTYDAVTRIFKETNCPMAAHLTYICCTKQELEDFTDRLWDANIRHIVALRGDLPNGMPLPALEDRDFPYTSDFIAWLKSRHDFEISVGAYPEKHPDAPDLESDIEALRLKCEAGADRAITQFFFDNDVYFRFLEKAEKAGIKTPIVPGLLPVLDFDRMVGFAERCDTSVPKWLHDSFDKVRGNPSDTAKLSEEILTRQCAELMEQGVEHLHFYTLNRAKTLKKVIHNLKITP